MAEAHQRRLLQIRVQLHLVHGRPVAGGFQQRGELAHAEVGHADLAGQIIVHQRFHGAPGVGHRHVLGVQDIGAGFRKTDARGQRHRPVHQVEIQVVELQVVEGFFQGRLHVFRGVGAVPQLRGDPQVLAADGAGGERFRQGLAHFRLVAVNAGAVDVPVTLLQGFLDRAVHVAGVGLPGAQAEHRHGVAVFECQGLHGSLLPCWASLTLNSRPPRGLAGYC